eukprot:856730-Lingulodinium_polyedra.AAC.1
MAFRVVAGSWLPSSSPATLRRSSGTSPRSTTLRTAPHGPAGREPASGPPIGGLALAMLPSGG